MPRLLRGAGTFLVISTMAAVLAHTAAAADPAQLSVTGKPRAVNNAYGGLAVEAGVLGTCPQAGVVCTGSASITGHGIKKASVLGSATVYVSPGISLAITITLGKHGQKLLKKLGKLKIAISMSLTGPDGQAVTAANGGTIRLPKSLRPHH